MSLEKDITGLMEANVFKPAGKTELKKRGFPGKEYAIWYGNYLDGVVRDEETALSMIHQAANVEIYEIPVGWPTYSSKRDGRKIYPIN